MAIYFNQSKTVETRKISDYEVKGFSLGERGRARYELFVTCPSNLTELSGLMPGLKLGQTMSGRPKIVTGDDANGISLVLSAKGGYKRNTWGSIKYLKGSDVALLGKANGAFGDAGGIGSWDAAVLNLRKGFIRVRLSGRPISSQYYGFNPDGKFADFNSLDELICVYDVNGWALPFHLTEERGIVEDEWESVTALPLPEFKNKVNS